MPDRPSEQNFLTKINDIAERLRAAEVIRAEVEAQQGPLQGFENGSPIGDVRFLDFGRGIQATLIGDDFVQVTSDVSVPEFDAVVDSNLAQSLPAERFFRGIGEALTYLFGTVGLTNRSFVLVRPGTYTETSAWSNARSVYLFGTQSSPGVSTDVVEWRLNDFNGTSGGQYRIDNMTVRFGTTQTRGFTGASGNIEAHNCMLDFNGLSNTFQLVEGFCVLDNCVLQSMRQLGATVWGDMVDVRLIASDGANPQTVATTALHLWGLTLDGASSGTARTWTCPAWTTIHMTNGPQRVVSQNGSTALTLACASPNSFTVDNLGNVIIPSISVTGSPLVCKLRGGFATVTVAAPGTKANGGVAHRIDIQHGGAVDISGPAICDLAGQGNNTVTLRGNGIVARVTNRDYNAAANTMLDLIGVDNGRIMAAMNGTPTGTAKSYALDANCDRTILDFAGDSLFPVTGTDGGTANLVTVT